MEYNSFVFIAVISVFGNINLVIGQNNEENRYIAYLDDNNSTKIIDLHEKPDLRILQRAKQLDANKYWLFTQNNKLVRQRLLNGNSTSIKNSNFKGNSETVVVVHGWGGDENSEINKVLRKVFLDRSDVNFIVVDWSHVGDASYVTASAGAVDVGVSLATFLVYLHREFGMGYGNVHLIGFSLGAHVVGNAARYLFIGGQIRRITGLDPAGPLWYQNKNRLQATDAMYVEAIHTNKGLLGMNQAVGDTDFYPNGGQLQPGCSVLNPSCSHSRSYQLFAATVEYQGLSRLVGRKCASAKELNNDSCFGEALNMGDNNLQKTGKGLYRLKTTNTYPYF